VETTEEGKISQNGYCTRDKEEKIHPTTKRVVSYTQQPIFHNFLSYKLHDIYSLYILTSEATTSSSDAMHASNNMEEKVSDFSIALLVSS